jgi:hypothetical protein
MHPNVVASLRSNPGICNKDPKTGSPRHRVPRDDALGDIILLKALFIFIKMVLFIELALT